MSHRLACGRAVARLAVLCLGTSALALSASAATFIVNNAADTNTAGTLRFALSNASAGDVISVNLPSQSTIRLTSNLPTITQSLTINGNAVTIDGRGAYRPFFVNAPGQNVIISNLTVFDGKATGGGGSGGGLGAGGALFAMQGKVTFANVGFAGNIAQGGAGGSFCLSAGCGAGSGGGGLGGSGSGPVLDLGYYSGAGGGGVGQAAVGGFGAGNFAVSGGPGLLPGGFGGNGGANIASDGPSSGGANSGGGGSGGKFAGGGGGGTNGENGSSPSGTNGGNGGNGGFGGGGGGGGYTAAQSGMTGSGGNGGNGGFGGGGGQGGLGTSINGTGGNGGFGGGGGAGGGESARFGSISGAGGAGGYGGGNAGSYVVNESGGGGAGFGGAIFVCASGSAYCGTGATVSILNTADETIGIDNTAVGGVANFHAGGAQDGMGAGGALFLTPGTAVSFNLASGTTTSVIADIAGMTGDGGVIMDGAGTLALLNNGNSFTGGVRVAGGSLSLSSDGSLGNGGVLALANGTSVIFTAGGTYTHAATVTGDPAFVVPTGQTVVWNGSIRDGTSPGDVDVWGGGTLVLSNNANRYTGQTNVNAGTLSVTGSIASSAVTVASGATLSGTGKTGSTSIASGGTLAPGGSGTLTIAGNLTLAPGSNFADVITPTSAGLASVTGTANLNGNAFANFASGTYAMGAHYAVISAAGGLSGTFASLSTSGLPPSLRASLSYDANDVYLRLSANALAPSLASKTTTNQLSVVAAIDAAVSSGTVPSAGFNALYGLSSASLNSAVDQISGQIGPNISNAVGQSFLTFLGVTAEGGAGGAESYAPGSAYDIVTAPHRAQLGIGQIRLWGGGHGGHVGISADAANGAASLSATSVGLIGGADMQLGDGIMAGFTLDWGRQQFHSGNGSGISGDYAFGVYGRADIDAFYATAAFGYGWHQIATLRVVTVSGTDVLQGKENADDFGGRIEAGWRLPLGDDYIAAPYAAFAGASFESPAYAETALSGTSTFALSYAAHTAALGRSELGAHLNHSYDLDKGALTADLKAAWAHQLDDQPFTLANFENLATTSFQVLGVQPAKDTALLGLAMEVEYHSGLYLGLKGEGQFGAGTTMVEGFGAIGLRW